MLNAFTVDLEDYFHVSAFENVIDRGCWTSYESRIERNTERLLELLVRHNVRATFFALGWVARHYPQLIRRVKQCGHELASHSFWHRLVYRLKPEEFRADLLQSRTAIEDACGAPVNAYRAPSFSITNDSLWAFDILAEEAFACDSSIFPIHHDRYGIPNADRFLHRRVTSAGTIWEFPASTARLGPLNLPAAGGGYFRLYPWSATRRLLTHLNQRSGKPFMFYTHPWELDPNQPVIRGINLRSRFRHYINLSTTERKLEMLLSTFQFGPVSEVLQCAESRIPAHVN